MKFWSRIRSALRNLFHKKAAEVQLDDEVRSYVDMVADERAATGMSPIEARRATLAELGGVEQVKQAVRDRRAGAGAELLWQDIRSGLRQMRRSPGFALTVIVTLALSVGANTAIFSVVNTLMLTNLPYTHPERLGTIYARVTGKEASDERAGIDGESWELLRDYVPALISAISGSTSGVNLQAGAHVQFVHDGRISAHYLDVLNIHPMIGRNFSAEEDQPHGPVAAVLSYSLWNTVFGGDRNILGQAILLKGAPYTVIGVLPEGTVTPQNADLYTPLQAGREGEGGGTNFDAIVRLRDGATWQEANAQINRAWAAIGQKLERNNPGATVTFHAVQLQKAETDLLGSEVLALMLAAGFILLIACANLAGLTLVRVLRRTPEIATRLALGASRWQIQKQLWIENLILALAGGAAGVGVGFVALRGLLQLLPEHLLPVTRVSLDGRVLAFTLAISMLTSVLFGMLPALTTRRSDLRFAIGIRTATGGDHLGLRQILIAGEVALTVVLLAASGLLIRTLVHLETLAPGFNPNGVMVAKASLDDVHFRDPATFRNLLSKSTAAMQQIPGIESAAVGLSVPYEGTLNDGVTLSDGKEAGQESGTDVIYVTPEYFKVLQMPILAGRAFTAADGPDAQRVAVVNEAFARKFYGGASPIGRYINKDTAIVGEVTDVAVHSGLSDGAPLMSEQTMYIPAAQAAQYLSVVHIWFQPDWIVRTAGPMEGLTEEMQRTLASVDPNLPFSGFYSMRDLMATTLATQRVEVALLTAMAMLALLLSAVGIFALVANMVQQRTREIGIRIALGSSVRQAMVHIGLPGARAVMLGLALGLLLCAGSQRAMRSVIYGVGVYDATTILMVTGTLVLVALIAVVLPTLRITVIDPAMTLREE